MRKLGLGLGLVRGKAAPTSLAINTVAPTLSATPVEAGQTATITDGTWSNAVSYQYRVLRNGDVVDGRTASTFTIAEEDEATDLVAEVRANDALGVWSAWVSSNTLSVPAVLPSVFTVGMWTLTDPSSDNGDQLTVTISSLPDTGTGPLTAIQYDYDTGSGYGAKANLPATTTGIYTITLDTALTATSVRLYAVNAHGSSAASDVKSATPTSPFANVAPDVTDAAFSTASRPNVLSFNSNEAGTLFYATNGSATPLAGSAIEALVTAATPDLYGSFIVDPGDNSLNINPAPLAVGTHYLHITVKDDGGLYSTDDVVTIVVSAPAISSTSPADNATGVAINVSPTITFNGPIAFGTGNIVLRQNNGGWADLETFDVATEQGTGAGQVSISGSTLTINPTADLTNSREYAIRIASTAIDDIFGNSFAGVADDTTISFTTVAAASFPTIASVGTEAAAGSAGSITPTLPAHQTDDILCVVMSNRGNDEPDGIPSGWAAGAAANTTSTSHRDCRLYWKRATSSAETNPTFTRGTFWNHIVAQPFVVRGCIATGTPFEIIGTPVVGTTSASPAAPGGAVTNNNSLVVSMFSSALDSEGPDFSAWANADLSSVAEIYNGGTTNGVGSAIGAARGNLATAATIGGTTATLSASASWSALTVAFIPA